jgi:hypothetical protein
LITYSPFHFVGDVGVSVGVEFTLDLWICTIHINVDIGAQLHLQGPPFSGYVYVDFWVFGFTVYFGHSDNSNDPIDLPAFWQLLLQQPGDTPITTEIPAVTSLPLAVTGPTNTPATIQQVDHAHVFAVEAGRSPGKSKTESMETKPGALWVVRPQGFRFRVQSLFAIGAASCNEHSPVAFPTSIYAKPMQLVAGNGSNDGSILSNLTIKVDFVEKLGVFKCDPVVKKVPKALWGACESISF